MDDVHVCSRLSSSVWGFQLIARHCQPEAVQYYVNEGVGGNEMNELFVENRVGSCEG